MAARRETEFGGDESVNGFLPTLGKALVHNISMRNAVRLHQEWQPQMPRNVHDNELLLVRTLPLHIRTVYGKVVDELVSRDVHQFEADAENAVVVEIRW